MRQSARSTHSYDAIALLAALVALVMGCRLTCPTPTPDIPATVTAVAASVYATATAEVAPAPPTPPRAPTPTPAHAPTPTFPSQPGPLPLVIAAFTLGDAPRPCVGSALAVDTGTGFLYSAGIRDGSPCLTTIDPATSQVLETRAIPFEPQLMLWDGGTLYAIGQDGSDLLIADASTGQIVARELTAGHLHNGRVVVRDGWAYVGIPGDMTMGESGALYLMPLREGAPMTISGIQAFDLADDGRIAVSGLAVIGGEEMATVWVYAGTDGTLLAEREIGPGQPGESLAFVGQTDLIFVTRRLPGEELGETRYFMDILDATSLETIGSIEEWMNMLTADPSRGRVYAHTSEGRVWGFDASTGQSLGTLFNIPLGEPGVSSFSPWKKLRVDLASGRIHFVTTDFDGGVWAAVLDPGAGTGAGDVQVPGSRSALDGTRGRLYFAGRNLLLALDAVTLQPVWRMSLSHDPVSASIAPDQAALFVGDAGGDVHVLDLQTHAETQLLVGVGGYVDVDLAHGWLYAGDMFSTGVSVYDLATLELRGIISQPGRPTASPADGLVYILEEDVYSGDGQALAVIEGRTTRFSGCNGCSFPTGVIVDPRSGITHTTTYGIWIGKAGPTSSATVDPLTGRAFVARTSGGYRIVNTLSSYADLTLEQELAWRDGIYGRPLYNPATGHLYLTRGSRLLVLDGGTLDLIGWLHPGDESLTPAAVDGRNGRLYLLAGPQVLVLEGTGGWPETPPPQPIASLPGPPGGIVPLPNGSLFVRAYDRENYTSGLYRSTDGGGTWEEIRGGLPGAPNDLAFAPDGTHETQEARGYVGTLYAAAVPTGWRAETDEASWGEGVYRSEDGGDTWALLSRGLAHLRVERVCASEDGAVHALANGMWPDQRGWPVVTIWRLGADDRWTQVEVPEAGPYVDAAGSLPYTYTQAIDTAWHTLSGGGDLYRSWGSELQLSTDAGLSWEMIGLVPTDQGGEFLTGGGDPPALYWLTWGALYRSTDLGVSWVQLSHPALADSGPTAIAVAEWDGEETLFVGTEAGELLVLPAAEADWR